MNQDNPNQPRKFDAVLGGQAPPPTDGVVLGGIEGVKHRLKSLNLEVQIAALTEAMNYGEPGLDLVIDMLERSPKQTQRFISRLLREKGGQKGKRFLLNYDPWLFFTSLEDWNKDELYSKANNFEANETIQVVTTSKQTRNLLEKPQSKNLVALVCEVEPDYNDRYINILGFVNALVENHQKLPNFKVLFAGDSKDSNHWRYGCSQIYLCNIYPLLKAFPNLEVLHLCGHFGRSDKPLLKEEQQKNEILQIRRNDGSLVKRAKIKPQKLKTLIIEGADLTDDRIAQICQFEYPSLEYLELWLGRKDTLKIVEIISPILSGECCPNLLYLGLIGSENTNAIVTAIAKSEIIKHLKVLDLASGNLSNAGVLTLLDCPAVNNLHTLNVSENQLQPNMIEKISQLKCQVIADSQFHDRYYRYYSVWE